MNNQEIELVGIPALAEALPKNSIIQSPSGELWRNLENACITQFTLIVTPLSAQTCVDEDSVTKVSFVERLSLLKEMTDSYLIVK